MLDFSLYEILFVPAIALVLFGLVVVYWVSLPLRGAVRVRVRVGQVGRPQ
ncbi:MAG: hypothetical protein M3198_06215 [Actinomycetota bacterium]|nr:hypothetical protein [Actinomycetota bacterium]